MIILIFYVNITYTHGATRAYETYNIIILIIGLQYNNNNIKYIRKRKRWDTSECVRRGIVILLALMNEW